MLQGLYTAASGLEAVEGRHSVAANNIANASTVGFRRQEPIQKGFYALFSDEMLRPGRFNAVKTPGGGTAMTETFTDTKSGPILMTDNPLNVALNGPGFMSVDTPQGKRYTRAGQFTIDKEGQLATSDGFKVLAAGGNPIDIPRGSLGFSKEGDVLVDNQNVGQLELTEFANPHALSRDGNSLYFANEAAGQQAAEKTTILEKSLETSNVNLPEEMVSMILGLRAYGANQKVMNAFDETAQRLIEQVGMPV